MKKTQTTKRALLSSVLALVLCMSMFLGTTFAWFTDSVTSANNIIVSGNLDVEMHWAQGTEDPATADWKDASKTAIFSYDNWEPGYVDVKHVKISNVGTLGLEYLVNIKANGEVSKLAEVIDVYLLDPAAKVGDRSELLDTYKLGTLADALNGVITPVGAALAANESDIITIALKMQEAAGNEYQNLSIGSTFSVQVLATQLINENDSFGNDYDANARIEYTYDSTKTAKENAAALQALIDTAVEGATVVVPAGTYDVSGISGKQIKLAKNGVTLLGMPGAIINDDGETGNNVQAVINITGDNVTVNNVYATDKGTNTVILVSGANNVTVTNCTLKGYAAAGHGQYLEAGVMIYANDPVNDPITKYTVTNNTFIDCNINVMNGAGNGGVAEDLIISGNTFNNAAVLIEHNQTDYSTGAPEAWHIYDINVLPTIKDNVFESPSIWLGSTPFAIYLRVYRDNDVATMTPASYWTDFAANNTIKEYNGTKLSTDGTATLAGENGVQMRPNGKVQYYGLNFATAVSTADGLKDALALGGDIALTEDVTVAATLSIPADKTVNLDLNGNDLSYAIANSGASAIINNKGTLNIIGTGTISFVAENPDLGTIPAYATNTITNTGSLTIGKGVTVTNGSDGGASYAVDNHGTFVLNGGTLIGNRCALRIAKYNQDNVSFVMNSGLVKAATPAWIQLPGNNPAVAPKITVEINGGTFESTKASSADNNVLYTYSYGNSHANTSITINGGEFLGGVVSIGSGYKGDVPTLTINGGTFEYDVIQWLDNNGSNVLYGANK